MRTSRILTVLAVATCWSHEGRTADGGAASYLDRLQDTIGHAATHLPAITLSAEEAVGHFLSGSNLWVASRQADFVSPAIWAYPLDTRI